MTSRLKHIGIKYHHFRKAVVDGIVKIQRVDSEKQKADIFTKGLSTLKFQKIRRLLMDGRTDNIRIRGSVWKYTRRNSRDKTRINNARLISYRYLRKITQLIIARIVYLYTYNTYVRIITYCIGLFSQAVHGGGKGLQ